MTFVKEELAKKISGGNLIQLTKENLLPVLRINNGSVGGVLSEMIKEKNITDFDYGSDCEFLDDELKRDNFL